MGGPRIALVESDLTYARQVTSFLANAGYEVRHAATGSQAYRLIRSTHPQLVLAAAELDHPQGGWILLNVMRRLPSTKALPVILYSDDGSYLEAVSDLIEEPRYQFRERPLDTGLLTCQIEQLLVLNR